VTQVLTGLGISKGLDWSPDGHLFYFVDSLTRRLSVFDHDPASGRISNRKTLVEFDESLGLPDGLTVDAEGCISVALWGGMESAEVFSGRKASWLCQCPRGPGQQLRFWRP
jgi:sugar lactone lactonase YvrE